MAGVKSLLTSHSKSTAMQTVSGEMSSNMVY